MKQFFQPYGLTENKTETLSQSIITKLQLPARSSQEPDWLQSDISQIKLESALSINYKETEYWSLSAQSNWFTNRCWKCFSPPAHCNMSVERESYTTPCQWGPSLTVRVTLCHCACVTASLRDLRPPQCLTAFICCWVLVQLGVCYSLLHYQLIPAGSDVTCLVTFTLPTLTISFLICHQQSHLN